MKVLVPHLLEVAHVVADRHRGGVLGALHPGPQRELAAAERQEEGEKVGAHRPVVRPGRAGLFRAAGGRPCHTLRVSPRRAIAALERPALLLPALAALLLGLAACPYPAQPASSPGGTGGGPGAGGAAGGGAGGGGVAGEGGGGTGGAGATGGGGGEGGAPGRTSFDVHLSGSGFAALEGRSVRAAVIAASDGERRVRASSETRVAGGAFELHFAGVLPDGDPRAHELDVFLDADRSGGCDSADLAWRVPLGPTGGDVLVELVPAAPLVPEACRSFPPDGGHDASVGGRGFQAHEAQLVQAALSQVRGGSLLAGPIQEAVVVHGRFEILFAGLLFDEARETTVIDYFVDVDGDGACDPPPTDHVWRLTLGKGTGNAHRLVADDLDFSPEACRSFGAGR